MKLIFPDACWRPDMISGALFLYFKDEKIAFTLHPSVSTFLTGIDPFSFIAFAEERKPAWLPKLLTFRNLWYHYNLSLQRTYQILEPLRGSSFITIWLSYPRGRHAWELAEDLIASSALSFDEITNLIDPYSASDELFSHIFFEKYLELYEGHRSVEEMVSLGKEQAALKRGFGTVSVDWEALYEYCDRRFGNEELGQTLTTAYMFRLPFLREMAAVFLSNPRMVEFLSSLPIERTKPHGEVTPPDLDVIAWEFFRQLISPRLDPIVPETVNLIGRLLQDHSAEINALRRRCLALAQDLSEEKVSKPFTKKSGNTSVRM